MNYQRNLLADKINMDELYARSQKLEENKIKVYRTILGRIHSKIKITSRLKPGDLFCFFVIPEFLMGVPRYDVASCTNYVISKLNKNGFHVKYTYPNLLFISWRHYIPAYRRLEYKKSTGISIDGFGNVVKEKEAQEGGKHNHLMLTNKKGKGVIVKKSMNFKKIDTYKPTGTLIYNANLLKKISERVK